MPPSTTTRQPAVRAARLRSACSMRSPSATEFTRRSISHPASGAMTLGREPPHTGATFSVMPLSTSTIAVQRQDLVRQLHHRRGAVLERGAGMGAPALHPQHEAADALARGDAGAAGAGRFRDQHRGGAARPRVR